MPRSLAAVVEDNWNRGEQRLEIHRLVKLRTYFACYVVIQTHSPLISSASVQTPATRLSL